MNSFVVNAFWGVYLENLFRTPYTGNLFAKNLLRKPYSRKLTWKNLLREIYSGKLIQEPYSRKNLFMKTIGHTKSLRKWPVDVLNSIFAK